MRIPASRLDEYTAALNAQQRAAYAYMQTMLRTFRQLNGGASAADLRDFAQQALYSCITQFGAQSASVACSAYDSTMAELGMETRAAEPVFEADMRSVSRSVDYFLRGGVRDFDSFSRALAERAYNDVGRAAHLTTIANAERDGSKGVRYARVPTGKETCGFCLMLASRGFAYRSAESAGYRGFAFNRFHDRCDCRVVAGDESTTVDGYDPDWLYEVYRDARQTVDADGMRKRLAAQGMDASEADRRIRNAISNEIGRRDASWAWSGKEVSASVAAGAEPSATTLAAAETLAAHGMPAHVLGAGSMSINGMRWMVVDGDVPDYGHLILADDGSGSALAEARRLVDSGGAAEALVVAPDGTVRRVTSR